MSATVYGASDDLIEIEGDISEEFYALGDDEVQYLAFSNGALLSVVYGNDGIWNIRVLAGDVGVTRGTDIDTDYTDRAEVRGDVQWVVCGRYAKVTP